ncbi:MAG: PilZ domain-containing protein [Oligoflexia bacterium]|nr:PilZ domain-containing protein [Oligoflexia bacterium]
MFRRPRQFEVLAMVLLLVAVSLPLQVMTAYGFQQPELAQIFSGLAPLNWAVMACAGLHAVLLLAASRLVFFTAPLFVALVAWNNWVVAAVGLNASTVLSGLATLGAVALHLPLLADAPRRILLNPRLRWWRTARRRRARVSAVVRPVLGGEIRTSTFDVSVGGAFIALEHVFAPGIPLHYLREGSRCSIRLVLNQIQVVQCAAEIVRRVNARGSYPEGFAVRFVCLEGFQRKMLKEFVAA